MLRQVLAIGSLLAAGALVACGDDAVEPGSRTSVATTVPPALARTPRGPGEIVFAAESSPATHGPLRLDGRYLVRFEQVAPEDPSLDFAHQTPFTATLRRREGDPQGAVKLFSAARRSGRRELTLHGSYLLDVSFGDFPYAVRFMPRR